MEIIFGGRLRTSAAKSLNVGANREMLGTGILAAHFASSRAARAFCRRSLALYCAAGPKNWGGFGLSASKRLTGKPRQSASSRYPAETPERTRRSKASLTGLVFRISASLSSRGSCFPRTAMRLLVGIRTCTDEDGTDLGNV